MSLDIYAKIKGKKIHEYEAIDNSYKLWTRKERKEKCTELTHTVLNINITHNLGKMASKVPIEWHDGKTGQYFDTDLYYIMWRPEEVFVDTVITLDMLARPLEIGLKYLLSHESELSKYNPENNWGHYENFVEILPQYIRACYKWPDAILEIDR